MNSPAAAAAKYNLSSTSWRISLDAVGMIIPGAIRFNVAAIDQKVAASTYSKALTRVDATYFKDE